MKKKCLMHADLMLFLLWIGISDCKKNADHSAPDPSSNRPSPLPVDHTTPGELGQGDAVAFALSLPRGMKIDAAFVDLIFASGQVPLTSCIDYIRSRVYGGKLSQKEGFARFEHVHTAQEPHRILSIQISGAMPSEFVQIEIRDTTPPPPPALADEEAQWRAVGLHPNGQPIDPQHVY